MPDVPDPLGTQLEASDPRHKLKVTIAALRALHQEFSRHPTLKMLIDMIEAELAWQIDPATRIIQTPHGYT